MYLKIALALDRKHMKHDILSPVPKLHHAQAKPLAYLHVPYFPWIFF